MSQYIPMQIQYPSGCAGVNSSNWVTIQECEQLPLAENSMQRFVYDTKNQKLISNWKDQCLIRSGVYSWTTNCENGSVIDYVKDGNYSKFIVPGTKSNNWIDYCYSAEYPNFVFQKCTSASQKLAKINDPSFVPITFTENVNVETTTAEENTVLSGGESGNGYGATGEKETNSPVAKTKKSSSLGMIIGIIVGVIVLIISVGAGFFLYQKGILKI